MTAVSDYAMRGFMRSEYGSSAELVMSVTYILNSLELGKEFVIDGLIMRATDSKDTELKQAFAKAVEELRELA